MSNASGATASREEEIALLAMEQVLSVDIKLADAGAGNKQPDGAWDYPDGHGRRGIVEITSPPATRLMREWAAAKRQGRAQTESGSVPLRLGELAEVCAELLADDGPVRTSKSSSRNQQTNGISSCSRVAMPKVTTSTGCPTPTTTPRVSTSMTSSSRTASRTSGSEVERGGTHKNDRVRRRSGWRDSKRGSGGIAMS